MTPTPLPSGSGSGEVWHNEPATLGGVINMDLLMPNGLLIPVNCPTDRTLAALKVDLFVEAKKYPLYDRLLAPTDYIFYTVALSGEKEEFYDESRTIDSLRLFVPVLRLVEPEGNREEKQLAHDIGVAIGHPLSEVEHGLNSETEAARLQLYRIVESSVKERRHPETNADMYAFPEDLTSDSYPLPSTSDCLIAVWMKSAHNVGAKEGGQKMTIKCDVKTTTPDDLLRLALKGRYQRAHPVSADLMQQCSSQYVLKAVGLRLYLTNAVPLCRFSYIRSCLEKKTTPLLMMMSREAVLKETAVTWELIPPSWIRARGGTQDDEFNLPQASSLWKNQDMFKVRIHSASHINVTDVDLIYVKAAIFHGPDMIISRDSKKVTPSNPRWSDSWIEYDFFVPDIPPSAQICFSVVSVKIRKTKEEHLPLGWANLRLMDWRSELIQGKHTLYLWPFPKDFSDNLYPIGTNGSNPSHETIRLEVEFVDWGNRVEFPDKKQIYEYVETVRKWKARKGEKDLIDDVKRPPKAMLEVFEQVRERDSQELADQEQQVLWKMREYARNYPNMLPRLLDAVQWWTRDSVSQLYVLLDTWKPVSPDTALELLDIKFPDRHVRAFAVKCLDELDDDRLQLYMMSLVQVLKYEAFSTCELACFLLRRALRNHKIGHMLFWLVRAELGEAHRLHTRFAIILEAYARGVGPYLHSLLKQVDAVERLNQLSLLVKKEKEKDSATKKLQSELKNHVDIVQFFESPLDPSAILGTLELEHCKVIGSAKLPLRLIWHNPEPLAEMAEPTHEILFKNGDDLRQDMLTLQVLRIMDSIWKAEGYDFSLNAYGCLPMGKNIGMIEVVKRSKTIFEIQCGSGSRRAGAFNIGPQFLNKWIRHHNNESARYLEAVDRFTRSCAGYCVATFVLGIKDRHQDNIMVTEDGRIFHIDFGHFLGHYKKKLGINRDRVPFVLTDNFIYVIAKGKTNFRESHEFKKFQQLCGEAYMILHKHAKLFISLFTMMLCMGIPELQKLEDVNYLRRTLGADMNDEDALAYFQEQLNDAYEGGWTTKTNWFFHSVRHGL